MARRYSTINIGGCHMKKVGFCIALLIGCISMAYSQIPYLQKNQYGATQLMVHGKPFLLIAGEAYNSSASSIRYMQELLPSLLQSGINTVLLPVAWEQIEHKQGVFDFNHVTNLIKLARQHQLKLGILWFGSWKNGTSPYAPLWLLEDVDKYQRVKNAANENTMTLSPFCEATKQADKRAFSQLVKHIATIDAKENTVITIQVENEVGVFGQSKDLCSASLAAYNKPVPERLMAYMQKNKAQLETELHTAWQKNGYKNSGTWTEVFGKNETTDLFFMAWHYASYLNEIAAEGKKQYALPMFVNCWMPATPLPNPRPNYTQPGTFPSGGPVIMVMDIWKAAAPAIDIVTPDIYGADFDLQSAFFHRQDNPLFIPETNPVPGRATYTFGKHNAICFSPFGIDDKHTLMKEEYSFLQQLMPLITQYQGSTNLAGFYKHNNDSLLYETKLNEDVLIKIYAKRPYFRYNELIDTTNSHVAYGLFVKVNDNDFFVAGKNIWVAASSLNTQKTVWLKNAWQGMFKNGVWMPNALHNGDEAGFLWSKKTPVYRIKPQPTIQPCDNTEPAIFKFKALLYSK